MCILDWLAHALKTDRHLPGSRFCSDASFVEHVCSFSETCAASTSLAHSLWHWIWSRCSDRDNLLSVSITKYREKRETGLWSNLQKGITIQIKFMKK